MKLCPYGFIILRFICLPEQNQQYVLYPFGRLNSPKPRKFPRNLYTCMDDKVIMAYKSQCQRPHSMMARYAFNPTSLASQANQVFLFRRAHRFAM